MPEYLKNLSGKKRALTVDDHKHIIDLFFSTYKKAIIKTVPKTNNAKPNVSGNL